MMLEKEAEPLNEELRQEKTRTAVAEGDSPGTPPRHNEPELPFNRDL